MTDNKIGSGIRPIAEPRAPEKSQRKEPVSGQDFSNTLKQVLNEINRQPLATPAGSDIKAIQVAADAAQKQQEIMDRVARLLRDAHRDITHKPTPDKE